MITELVSWSESLLYLLATLLIILYFVPIINSIFNLHIIGCKEMELYYTVVRSKKRKKTISLHVKANGTAVVYAPHRTPIPEIDKFMREKEKWLWRKIRENGERQKEIKAKKYVTGEIFFFLGEPYPLKIERPLLDVINWLFSAANLSLPVIRSYREGSFSLTGTGKAHRDILGRESIITARSLNSFQEASG